MKSEKYVGVDALIDPKNNHAITLIALIITIIILLILAGVTINLILGDNGLFKTAKQAGESYDEAAAREKLEAVLVNIQAEKITNPKFNEQTDIDNRIIENDMSISGNIVIVDGWQFEIDRSIPKIADSIGKVQTGKEFRLEKFTIDLNANRDSIKITITSVNGIQGGLNNNEVEYRFSKDNGNIWTPYQTDSTYIFNELYGDLSGENYSIVVEAKDKKGNIKKISQSVKTNCLLTQYYRNTANELLLTVDGRTYKKTNNNGAIAGVMFIAGNWIKPILVSQDPLAVEYYTSYSNTSFSSAGSIEYYGTKYYYSSGAEGMPSSSTYTTNIPVLNSTTNVYANPEEAARALLDRYFLKTVPRNTANELVCDIGGRKFYKTNNKEAIVALIKHDNNQWMGPILVSTDSAAVEYYNSYSNSNISSAGSIEYRGTKYYYSNYLVEFMPTSSTYTTTLPILNENGTNDQRILDFISKYFI